MEDLIKKIKEMQPTKEQLEGRTPEYAFGYVDALNEAVKLVNVTLGSVSKRFWHFDCWDRTGEMQTITIEALNEENATIIFEAKHEDLGFDPPY